MKYLTAFFSLLYLGTLIAAEWPLAEIKIRTADPANPIQKLAGRELEKHLHLIAGRRIPGEKYLFLIGVPAPDWKGKLERTEAHYAVRGCRVYFWGDDHAAGNADQFISHPQSRFGSLNAVYAFLESELGVKWLRPGDAGIAFEPREKLALPERKDYNWVMPLEMTGARVYWWRDRLVRPINHLAPEELRLSSEAVNEHHVQDLLWARRMRHGFRMPIRYGHAFTGWWNKYGKDHPEYFGMDVNSKRGLPERLRGREKLCVSNPEVVDVIIREWVERGKPKYLNICPNDGTPGFCRCSACMALDTRKAGEDFYAHLTDRYVYFWNRIAEKAVKLRPDVQLVTYVYSYYRYPPRREKVEYPDNLLFGMVPQMFEDNRKMFEEWWKAGARQVFLRPNDLCAGMPFTRGLERLIYDKFQASRKFRIFGTDYDGSCGVRNIDLEYYIVARMIHAPDRSFEELENEYYSAYGAAAPEVRQYHQFWRKIGEGIPGKVAAELKKQNRFLNDAGQIGMVVNENIAHFYREQDFLQADAVLQKAQQRMLSIPARRLLDELILINRHSLFTWHFIREANRKAAGKENRLEQAARDLVAFRVRNRDCIDWKWPELFASLRTEKKYWENVEWYRKEVLKEQVAVPRNPDLVFHDSFDHGTLGKWKKRQAFKAVSGRPAGSGYCLEFKAGREYAMGASLHQIKVTPGKRYRLSSETLLSDEVQYLRLRMTGGGKTLLNQVIRRRKSDEWQSAMAEFDIPAGVDSLTLYVIVGPGSGKSAYLDNVKLVRIDENAADAI